MLKHFSHLLSLAVLAFALTAATESPKPPTPQTVPLSSETLANFKAAEAKMEAAQAEWRATLAGACADAGFPMAECQVNVQQRLLLRVKPQPVAPPVPAKESK